MKKLMAVVFSAGLALAAQAVGWKGLGEGNYYAGPKVTEADLAGKVVLVDCWGVGCPPCRALLPRMEEIWKSFRSKPFVLLGSHRQGRQPEKVAALVKANKLTYPQYDGAGIAEGAPSFRGIPCLYVVNHRGKVVYSGHDERAAIQAVVEAITEIGAPPTLIPGVILSRKSPYKSLEKRLILGKPAASVVKKLQGDIKKASARAASAVQKAAAEEAEAMLKAIEEAKTDYKTDIARLKTTNPPEALKMIKAYMASFPAEGAEYKDEIADLTVKAKEFAAEQKAKGATK